MSHLCGWGPSITAELSDVTGLARARASVGTRAGARVATAQIAGQYCSSVIAAVQIAGPYCSSVIREQVSRGQSEGAGASGAGVLLVLHRW